MEFITDICSKCQLLRQIQNKKHWMCGECVFEKNHDGKTKEEVYADRAKKKLAENKEKNKKILLAKFNAGENIVAALKKTFTIKRISNKRAERLRLRDAAYKNIDQTRDAICESCLRSDVPLSHSHILSERVRPDLYGNEDNIRLHCYGNYNSCHETFERGISSELARMADFPANLSFIKEVDIKKYNAIIAKFEFDGVKIPKHD